MRNPAARSGAAFFLLQVYGPTYLVAESARPVLRVARHGNVFAQGQPPGACTMLSKSTSGLLPAPYGAGSHLHAGPGQDVKLPIVALGRPEQTMPLGVFRT